VRSGSIPFSKLDVLHRRNLERVLKDLGRDDLPETARAKLNLAWHRLDAWPDVGPGLTRLRQRFRIAPCSNGNISLMADLARRNGWHWDAILGAELARDYKPKPEVYRAACDAFDCAPRLQGPTNAPPPSALPAARAGLRTAFIARPDEQGPGRGETCASVAVEFSAADLGVLADCLA
jgi:2-haloacid dehalogenase